MRDFIYEQHQLCSRLKAGAMRPSDGSQFYLHLALLRLSQSLGSLWVPLKVNIIFWGYIMASADS